MASNALATGMYFRQNFKKNLFVEHQPSGNILPTVSILMPMRNAAPWLEECLDSIRHQVFQDWELIIVDDHSSDTSTTIVERFAHDDTRITLLPNNGNGIIAALQTALIQTKGALITRMDADDVMPKNKLTNLFRLAHGNPNVIATGRVQYFCDAEVSEGYRAYEAWLNQRCLLGDHWSWVFRECVIASANWMCHRRHAEHILHQSRFPEDYDLVLHWYRQGLQIASSQEVTHLWREHPARTSRNSVNYAQEAFFQLKIQRFFEYHHDPNRPLVLFGQNKKSALCRQVLDAFGWKSTTITLKNIDAFDKLQRPLTLVAVYPDDSERVELAAFFEERGMRMGEDYWFV